MGTTKIIYEPKGAAREYAHLAVNLYTGCRFACKYCYGPDIARQKLSDWSANPQPRKDILKKVEADAKKIAGDKRTILLCFTCDPYQSPEAAALTRKTLLILEKYDLTATVLTKAGQVAAQDFDILKRNNWEFGSTICCTSDTLRRQWEPKAATLLSRYEALIRANQMGIKTWVSMEPVYDAVQALRLIKSMHHYVDFWKVGKMNYKKVDIDWAKFHADVVALLDRLGAKYYIKKDLAAYK